MTNKEKYIKSVDNLKADEYLKAKTINKAKEEPKQTNYIKFANAMIAICLVISCVWIIGTQEKVGDNSIYKNSTIAKADTNIKSVESIEQLQSLLKIETLKTEGVEEKALLAADMMTTNETTKYSETNVQVAGVDEADIVKTDGKYIYYAGNSNKVIIVEAQNLNKVAEIQIGEETKYNSLQEIYLSNNKLVVLSQSGATVYGKICYDMAVCVSSTTQIYVYNIEDKQNIIKERSIEISGDYISSRLIGSNVYVITNQYINNEEEIQPTYKDDIVGDESNKVECKDIYYVEGENSKQYLNIAAFNINENKKIDMQSFLGVGNTVYANEKNIYVTSTKYKQKENVSGDVVSVSIAEPQTYIYKFKMNDTKVEFKEFVKVKGQIVNQFSMDETDGYFRIATTTRTNENETSNNLYILDARLKKVGELNKIAEGESIYSVRFIENKAYIVTFKQTDPLFVIDLSNPSNPKIQGELKIPGYSSYIHPYDENHIIGIGRDSQEKADGSVEIKGIKISLFDISDMKNPKEVSTLSIGEKQAYSEALYNHKAVLFIKEKGILAFPITINENNQATYFAEVLKVTQDKITEKGRIKANDNNRDYENVERVIYIDNNLYTITTKKIIQNDLESLEQINRVDL